MKKVLFLLSIIVGTVFSAPHNNPVLQPSIWNGYGVDWCYSTLRVGLGNKDSLLEDGWALIDSLTSIYADIDSLHSSHMGSDSLDVLYLYARSSLIDSLDVDSILTASYADLDSLIYMIASGDSINSNIGNIDTLIADSINVASILATNNIDGNDVHATDSLSFATGNGTDLTLTNNLNTNDANITGSLTVSGSTNLTSLVTYDGGSTTNPANIFRIYPVLNKGYLSFNNATSTLAIRQDSTLAPGANNITLQFVEEDGSPHNVATWIDGNSIFEFPTFMVSSSAGTGGVYVGAYAAGQLLGLYKGSSWFTLEAGNSLNGILIDPNESGADTLQLGMSGDNDILHSECSENRFDAWQTIADYALTSGALVTESRDARPILMQWTGQVTHADFTAASTQEDVLIINGFPAKYKITGILIDVTEKFDDGGGAISAAYMSFGPTADPTSYLKFADVYTAATLVGDEAAEVAYTAVQGGIIPSWSATTNLYVRLKTAGGNVVDCTTGIANIYITYLAIE